MGHYQLLHFPALMDTTLKGLILCPAVAVEFGLMLNHTAVSISVLFVQVLHHLQYMGHCQLPCFHTLMDTTLKVQRPCPVIAVDLEPFYSKYYQLSVTLYSWDTISCTDGCCYSCQIIAVDFGQMLNQYAVSICSPTFCKFYYDYGYDKINFHILLL